MPKGEQARATKQLISDLQGLRQLLLMLKAAKDLAPLYEQLQFLSDSERAAAHQDLYDTAMEFLPQETTPEGMNAIRTLYDILQTAKPDLANTLAAAYTGRVKVLTQAAQQATQAQVKR
jgi:hypothetical protein